MLIRRPAEQVFEAFIAPAITAKATASYKSISKRTADLNMRKFIPIVIAMALSVFASGQTEERQNVGTACAQHLRQKIDPSLLEKTADGQSVPFLILLSAQADVSAAGRLNSKDEKATYVFNTLRNQAAETQENLIALLEDKHAPYASIFIVNAIKTNGTQELTRLLAQRNDVAQIIDNPTVRFSEPVEWSTESDNARVSIEWGIDMINADDVWAMGYRGQGVIVGGADTGYEWTHPALKKQYRGYNMAADTVDHNYNWYDAIHNISPLSTDSINPCGLDSREPCDDFGHGTHTMGTMIGLDGDNEIGVAPEARWCGCRNMESGNGSPFTYLECFQWFMAPTDLNNENPDPSMSPHVINNSWSCPKSEGCDSSNFEIMNMAVNNLRQAGIVVVVSAGNSGSGCSSISAPAAIFEGSFTVGATAINDTIAGFSSRGPVEADSSYRIKPNVSAPGVGVRSARPGGDYGNASGTSMAGPHVAGMVALIISANPDLAGKVDIIEDIIEKTAVPKTTDQICGNIAGSQVPNNTYGFGRIDALASVNAALALIPVNTNDEKITVIVRVYPNPVEDMLVIDVPHVVGKVHVELFDTQGRLLLRDKSYAEGHGCYTVDFSEKSAGIYFYRITVNGNVQMGKVFKK